ncbi:PREDICTED: uncharacterized protein LOC106818049 isoform X2 [Priapulus caudatus]|uniref:Uncharacterized protein LOC106818049 isoform X2 n=1 Tax=Priapulus caudatus TaxID=37621 RepID=A0ABM1F1D4_PRICU|nr:PREDICTED: uncharacterized protein LOC106818049 isoform X2 [Priapulus caudatus]XP_014678255.1 PREDICTED: uncharacterized protein LOC106818049 isoform X2 [Priapulus caudatus]
MEDSQDKEWVQFREGDTREPGEGESRGSQDSVTSTNAQDISDLEENGSDKESQVVRSSKTEEKDLDLVKTDRGDIAEAVECTIPARSEQTAVASPTEEISESPGAVIDTTQVEVNISRKKKSVMITEAPRNDIEHKREHAVPGEVRGTQPGRSILKHSSDIQLGSNSSASTSHRSAVPDNGQHLESVWPMPGKCVWVTKATFDTEVIPARLLEDDLTLPHHEYSMAMEFLVNDYRFNCYSMCYRRIIIIWLLLSFVALFAILFSGLKGLNLFAAGVIWLVVNAAGIILCLFAKRKWDQGMDRAVSAVNQILVKHSILMCMEDQGRLSCHKIMLHFYYFNITDCVHQVSNMLLKGEVRSKKRVEENPGFFARWSMLRKRQQMAPPAEAQFQHADDDGTIAPVAGETVVAMEADTEAIVSDGESKVSSEPKRMIKAEKMVLKYSQHYLKSLARDLINFPPSHIAAQFRPEVRHCSKAYCICQYIEERHFYDQLPRSRLGSGLSYIAA